MTLDNGFKVTPDICKRGNGRWAIIHRLHDRKGDKWVRKYRVAFGIESFALAKESRVYRLKSNALAFADMYIEDGTVVD